MSAIAITNDWHKTQMARAIPGAYYSKDDAAWVLDPVELTPRGAAVALKLFPTLGIEHPQLNEIRDRMLLDVRPFDNATPYGKRIEAPGVESVLSELGSSFFDYQALDLGYLADVLEAHGGAYLGWERGLGKTLGACALTERLGCRTALYVVPNTAKHPVWEPEVQQWLREYFEAIFVLPNAKKQRERTISQLREALRQGKRVCLITHYESLNLIAGKGGRGWDKFGEWDIVVADECHRIKNPKAQMSKALKRITTRYKLAMSGSIIMNHPEELFSQVNWLFPERYSRKWADWNDRFIDYVEGGYGRICVGVKLDKLDELRQELGVFMVYRRKEDELDLPPRTDEERRITMSPGQEKVYNELVAACVARLDDGSFVVADDGLPMLVKLRQIATGLDLVGNMKDSSKLDFAHDMIIDNEEGTYVVFSWFKAACSALAERLNDSGVPAGVITGDVSHQKRGPIIERFKAGELRVLCATIGTLGESQNLQVADNAVFLDRSWNPEDNAQAEDRIYRIGQERPVTITHLIAANTVDEHRVLPTVVNKQALRRLILGG